MTANKIFLTDIQRFCMHDGDGLRTTVFFKGCPLKCSWCHNPETQKTENELMFAEQKCLGCGLCTKICKNAAQSENPKREILRERCTVCGACASVCPTGALSLSGKEMTTDEIMTEVLKDRAFYGESGGLTVSGGEPGMQPEHLTNLLSAAHNAGIKTAVETCGIFKKGLAEKLVPLVDLFLFDIKHTDSDMFYKYTGGDLETVLSNLSAIDLSGGTTVLRCIMVPGVNMTNSHAHGISDIFKSLRNCRYAELLPYHPYGNSKSTQLGRDTAVFSVPERKDMYDFASFLTSLGTPVKVYGKMF